VTIERNITDTEVVDIIARCAEDLNGAIRLARSMGILHKIVTDHTNLDATGARLEYVKVHLFRSLA
jgi:hypothetical protein